MYADPDPLMELVRSDPEHAWPLVLAYAEEHPEDAGRTSALIEEFIYEHGDRLLDRMASAAAESSILRDLIASAYVGGVASRGAEEFHRLQARLQRESGWPEG